MSTGPPRDTVRDIFAGNPEASTVIGPYLLLLRNGAYGDRTRGLRLANTRIRREVRSD